jgi:hypothetical protein
VEFCKTWTELKENWLNHWSAKNWIWTWILLWRMELENMLWTVCTTRIESSLAYSKSCPICMDGFDCSILSTGLMTSCFLDKVPPASMYTWTKTETLKMWCAIVCKFWHWEGFAILMKLWLPSETWFPPYSHR